MTLVDSHCHLDGEDFTGDRDAVIERARAAGVETLVAIGTGEGPPDLEAGIRLADAFDCVYATVGVHPHSAAKASYATWPELQRLCGHPKVVALGEIGLDYHYNFSPPEVQRSVFTRQLEVAATTGQPVVIHTREAWSDTVALIRESGIRSGIFHCFSGGPDEAQEALSLGFHLSFAGIVTFPKAQSVQQAAREVPLDRLLVETDSPYLAPVPYRGKRNEPAFVVHTAARIAELRGISPEAVARVTTANWERLCLRAT
jgi:TatD DNase family protein